MNLQIEKIFTIWQVTKYLIVTRLRWINYYTNFDLLRRYRVTIYIQTARYSRETFFQEKTKKKTSDTFSNIRNLC